MVKLHVSACNGHHPVSTPIKKSLYIYFSLSLVTHTTGMTHLKVHHVVWEVEGSYL